MKKRIISFFTALSMTLMLFTSMPTGVSAEDLHQHKMCADSGHANCSHLPNKYDPFPAGDANLNVITSDKNYYLTDDLTDDTLINKYISVDGATVNLCLNGHTIITKGFMVYNDGVLNICDCKTGGCIQNYTQSTSYTGGVLIADNGGNLNVYGGKIRAQSGIAIHSGDPSTTKIYGGEISGGAIMVGNGSVLSVYGGTIKNEAEDCNGISVLNNADVYINGGTIAGGKYGIAANYSGSNININGGSVESRDNSALYIQNGVICTITDGTIKSANQSAVYTCDGGIANINGGDLTSTSSPTVWIDNEGIANISGGNISNSGYKSYIWNSGTMAISGGVFSANMDKGYIRNYGNFGLQGSPTLINTSIWLSSKDNITISGALENNDKYTVYVNSSLPRTFTSGWDTHMTDKNVSKYFNSPYDNSKIVYKGNEAVMVYYRITYDANGGSCIIASAEANASGKLASLAIPTRDGFNFDGWFTEADGGEQITTDTVFTDDTTIYAHWICDHDWGNWSITEKPTLTTTGTAERTCTKDSTHKDTKELPVLTDTTVWIKDDTRHVEPTEEEYGMDTYISEYGDVEIVLPKKEHTHDWGNWSITEKPTLTTTGTAERTCTKDSTHKDTKELPVLTDTTVWIKDDTRHVEPTEEEYGMDTYISEYGDVEIVLPKKEHTHSLVKTEAQDATCTTDGNEAYWTCSGCDKMFLDENGETEIDDIPVIPAGHKYSDEWKLDDNEHWHECTVCHDKKDTDAHTFVEGKCTVCQKSDPNYTQPTDTEPTVTEPPVTDPSDTEPPVTDSPVTDPSGTEPPVTEPPVTEPPITEPTVTAPPVTEPPITEPTVTAPPVTEPIVTNPPYTPYFPPNNAPAPAMSASREPFLQNENGKIGWDVISDNIWETPDGETVLVNMNGTNELPKNIVSDISGRDIDLVLVMNGGFVWTINGLSVTKAKTVNMGVRKVSKIPNSTVQKFFGDVKTIQIDLRHNGDFGFVAELAINIGNRYDGMYANSYCYKSRTFEFGDSSEIVNGYANLRFAHASSWLVTVESSPVLEDVSTGSAAHSTGMPIDMSNFTSRGITVPEFDFKKKLKLSNQKRRYRILKKRRLDDLVFVL